MGVSQFVFSPSQRRLQQGLIIGLTLCRLGLIAAAWWSNLILTQPHYATMAIGYGLGAILFGLVALLPRTKNALWSSSIVLELCSLISLLWLANDISQLIFALPLMLSIAVVLGYGPFTLTMLSAGIIFAWLMRTHQLQLSPLIANPQSGWVLLFWCVSNFLLSVKNVLPVVRVQRTTTDPQTGFGLRSQLEAAVTYLRPYHMRNQIPLSLLMIQLPKDSQTWQAVTNCLNQRLRNSDVVVRYGKQHIVLLLCDTNEHGASILAHHLNQDVAKQIDQHGVLFAISHLNVEGIALQPILDRMQQVLKHAEHKTDRVLFVSPLIREESK